METKKIFKCNYNDVKFETDVIQKQDGEKRDTLEVKGYFVIFDSVGMDDDGKTKIKISPNAFDETNLNGRIYLLLDHQWEKRLGRTGRNLELQIDKGIGGFMRCKLPNTQLARDAFNEVEDGILDGMSWCGLCEYEEEENGTMLLTKCHELYEVTLTAIPRFFEASVITASKNVVKSIENEVKEKDGNLQFNKLLNEIKEI